MSEKLEAAAREMRDKVAAAALEVGEAHGVQVSVRRLATEHNETALGIDVDALITVTEPGVFAR